MTFSVDIYREERKGKEMPERTGPIQQTQLKTIRTKDDGQVIVPA